MEYIDETKAGKLLVHMLTCSALTHNEISLHLGQGVGTFVGWSGCCAQGKTLCIDLVGEGTLSSLTQKCIQKDREWSMDRTKTG